MLRGKRLITKRVALSMWLSLALSTPSTSPWATTAVAPVTPTPIAVAPATLATPTTPPFTRGSLIAWLIKRSLVASSWVCALSSLWMRLSVCYSAPVRGAVAATLRTCTVTPAGHGLFTNVRVTICSTAINSGSFTSCTISWRITAFPIGRLHCPFASGCTMFYCFTVLKLRTSDCIFWVADTALIVLIWIASSTCTSAPAYPASRSLLLLIRSWLFSKTLSGLDGKSRWAGFGTAVRDPACIPVRRMGWNYQANRSAKSLFTIAKFTSYSTKYTHSPEEHCQTDKTKQSDRHATDRTTDCRTDLQTTDRPTKWTPTDRQTGCFPLY